MMCMCPGAPSSCFPFLVARCIWETQALLYARCDASYLARVLELHSKRWPCIPVCRSLWCRFSIDAVVHSHLWAMFKLVQVCQLLFVISMCSKQVMGIEAWRVDFSFSPHFTGIPKSPFLVLFSACFSFQSSGIFFTACLEYFHIIKADIPWNLRGEIPKVLTSAQSCPLQQAECLPWAGICRPRLYTGCDMIPRGLGPSPFHP